MKNQLLIALTIFIYSLSFSQVSWNSVESPIDGDLISVCFTDHDNGWILSADGMLANTKDAGESWEVFALGSGHYSKVSFTNELHGCILGNQDSSFIKITDDGGYFWSDREHLKAEILNDVFFIDNMKGWAVGIREGMNYNLYTADGGQTWSPQMDIFVMGAELNGVSFRNDTLGAACGRDAAFFITSSGGMNGWALEISIPQLQIDLFDIHNWGAQTGCAVGANGTALYTINNWYQHIETITNTNVNLYAVDGTGSSLLWAVGEGGTIIYTSNYLLGWAPQSSGITEDLRDVCAIDVLDAWAVGDNGSLLHYGLSAIDEFDEIAFTAHIGASSDQLRIDLAELNNELEIYFIDIMGKTIHQFNSNHQQSFIIDVADLQSGLYFIRVGSEYNTLTKKILLP